MSAPTCRPHDPPASPRRLASADIAGALRTLYRQRLGDPLPDDIECLLQQLEAGDRPADG